MHTGTSTIDWGMDVIPSTPSGNKTEAYTKPIPFARSESPAETSWTGGFSEFLKLAGDGSHNFPDEIRRVLYAISSVDVLLSTGKLITFDEELSKAIGGYPEGAILWFVHDGNAVDMVRSLKGDNTDNFVADPTKIDGKSWEWVVKKSRNTGFPAFAADACLRPFGVNFTSLLNINNAENRKSAILTKIYEIPRDCYLYCLGSMTWTPKDNPEMGALDRAVKFGITPCFVYLGIIDDDMDWDTYNKYVNGKYVPDPSYIASDEYVPQIEYHHIFSANGSPKPMMIPCRKGQRIFIASTPYQTTNEFVITNLAIDLRLYSYLDGDGNFTIWSEDYEKLA